MPLTIPDIFKYGQQIYDSLHDGLEDEARNLIDFSKNLVEEYPELPNILEESGLPDKFDSLLDALGIPHGLGNDGNPDNPLLVWLNGLKPDNKGKPTVPKLQQPTFDYLNAELAKLYGMDRNTAYQEALSNTSYQRAVRDMQAAGLNPAAIFGAGRGQGAQGVAYVSSGGSSYSGSAKDSKLFSSEDFGLIASLAGLATAVATKKPSNFWLGQQGAQAVMQVLNGLDRKFK